MLLCDVNDNYSEIKKWEQLSETNAYNTITSCQNKGLYDSKISASVGIIR